MEYATSHDRPMFGQSWPSLSVQLSSELSSSIGACVGSKLTDLQSEERHVQRCP